MDDNTPKTDAPEGEMPQGDAPTTPPVEGDAPAGGDAPQEGGSEGGEKPAW